MVGDQPLVDMDDELVAIIEQPDGPESMLNKPVQVACNGGAILMPKVPSQHLLPIAL